MITYLTPDITFEEFKAALEPLTNESGDVEYQHSAADDLLEKIALCVHLTSQERWDLIQIYRKVPKWYA